MAADSNGTVVGRLAVVTSDTAEIRGGRDREGRLLSTCPRGQYLAVKYETDTMYGVLMSDMSIGFVRKDDVRMLDYQVVNSQGGTLGDRLVQTAQQYLSVPYVWGGNTASGIDCSGLVKAVFATQGIELPRHSGDQAAVGYDVPLNNLAAWVPGDRMYFACHHPEIDHTAMYIGNGLFIHASMGHGAQVAIDRVDNPYYWHHLVAVRRSRELLADANLTGQQSTMQMAGQPTSTAQSSTQTVSASTSDSQPTTPSQPADNNNNNSDGNSGQSLPSSQPDLSDTRTVPPATDQTGSTSDSESGQQ